MNITHVIDDHADTDGVALVHRDTQITYAQLVARTGSVQAGLSSLGVAPGDRVMLVAGTTPDFVASLFGILRAGAVAVPVNPLAPAPEMSIEIDAVEPAAIMVGPSGVASLGGCEVAVPVITLPGASLDGAIAYEDFVVVDERPAPVDRSPDDLALLLFTSGTAGSPKAAMMSHGNLQANIDQVDAHAADLTGANDTALGVLPMFHILGLNLLLGVILRSGGSIVLVQRFDPVGTIDLIKRHHVTVVSGPPAMWQAWVNLPEVDPADFASVRLAISGAAALPREVANRVGESLGLPLTQGYGLTEAAPVLTLGAGTGAPATSVGRPVPGVQLRLVDVNGNDAPVGDEGEIWARGANIFSGYWNNPEATADALTDDGWLRTGDIGVVDDDGFLYIVDRTKDLVVVSGFNVYPGEVEEALRSHPGVRDAAAVGIPHPDTGEAVKAFVTAGADTALDEEEIIRFCESRLARYKCPQAVEVVDELPRGGAVGKLRRRALR